LFVGSEGERGGDFMSDAWTEGVAEFSNSLFKCITFEPLTVLKKRGAIRK
jgi:hypothetical protein